MIRYYRTSGLHNEIYMRFDAYHPSRHYEKLGSYSFEMTDGFTIENGFRWVADMFPEFFTIPYELIARQEIYN